MTKSTTPGADAATDERALFESALRAEHWPMAEADLRCDPNGCYHSTSTQTNWKIWQARAALPAPAVVKGCLTTDAPALCRTDGRCQYAIDHGAEGMGYCPAGVCCMPTPAATSAPLQPKYCSRCGGEGVIHTGADESSADQCKKCDGTGYAAMQALTTPKEG